MLTTMLTAAMLFAPPTYEGPLPNDVTQPACVGCEADFAEIQSRITEEEWKRLQRGKIVTVKEEEARTDESLAGRVFAYGVIPFPPQTVWNVLSDYDNWDQFLPKTEDVYVTAVSGDRLWLYHHIKVMWKDIVYTTIYEFEPRVGKASWVLEKDMEHDIADTEGFWEMVPVNKGKFTLVTYHAKVETGLPVPGFVEDFLTKKSLPQIVEGLRDEVEKRYGQ